MSSARDRALALLTVKVKHQPAVQRLKRIAARAPDRTRSVMGRAVAAWHAETVPHLPVRASHAKRKSARFSDHPLNREGKGPQAYSAAGRGQLKKRTQPFVKTAAGKVVGGLAIMTDYAIWLAAGTRRIAGGRVLGWKEGDRPITTWPAKRAGGNPRGTLPIALPYRAKAVDKLNRELLKEIIK